jgi:hypothetical protein
MKRAELRIPDYIAHILEAINRIAEYTAGMDEDSFLKCGCRCRFEPCAGFAVSRLERTEFQA